VNNKFKSNSGPLVNVLRAIVGAVSSVIMFLILLAINVGQMSSLALYPISTKLFRKANRMFAQTWWGLSVLWLEKLFGMNFIITGDELNEKENLILLSNHQSMADIPSLFILGWRNKMLGDMKWFVKDVLKYVPGPGWGMLFLGCIFLKRDWMADKASINRTFKTVVDNDVDLWLISFLEGTRLTAEKHEHAVSFAKQKNIYQPIHTLIPRVKGFVATVHGLREHVGAVCDVTIGYPHGTPSLWQVFTAEVRTIHLHVRRTSIGQLPESDPELSDWAFKVYQEKDELLVYFSENQAFPS
jgi:1-acyl-sn-glycerol-3-phosphate acyltransferase